MDWGIERTIVSEAATHEISNLSRKEGKKERKKEGKGREKGRQGKGKGKGKREKGKVEQNGK